MPRNLRDDFRMYYQGTYVTKKGEEVRRVMYVEEVVASNRGYNLSDIKLHGPVLCFDGKVRNDGYEAWSADQLEPYHPQSGYYKIGNTPAYLEFLPQNRTNRKGFEASRVVVNGRPQGLSPQGVAKVFANPTFNGAVFVDLCLQKSRLLWRGVDIGSFHDGELKIEEDYQYLEEYVNKLVARFTNKEAV